MNERKINQPTESMHRNAVCSIGLLQQQAKLPSRRDQEFKRRGVAQPQKTM